LDRILFSDRFLFWTLNARRASRDSSFFFIPCPLSFFFFCQTLSAFLLGRSPVPLVSCPKEFEEMGFIRFFFFFLLQCAPRVLPLSPLFPPPNHNVMAGAQRLPFLCYSVSFFFSYGLSSWVNVSAFFSFCPGCSFHSGFYLFFLSSFFARLKQGVPFFRRSKSVASFFLPTGAGSDVASVIPLLPPFSSCRR